MISGHIIGVLMQLDDLEWEWNDWIFTSSLAEACFPTMMLHHLWKMGSHPDNVKQICPLTLDTALSMENDFKQARAERMLALFLGTSKRRDWKQAVKKCLACHQSLTLPPLPSSAFALRNEVGLFVGK